MPWTPSRRSVLRGAAATVTTALAGCQWNQEETGENNLFLENTKRSEQVVQLIVSQGEEITDDRVMDAWYRVPEGVALQFEGVLEPGETYTIGMQAAGEPPGEQIGSTVQPCEGDEEATRDVSVRVREESHGIIPWGCDEEYTERELDYRDAEEYRVDPPADAEPWTTPDPETPGVDGEGDS